MNGHRVTQNELSSYLWVAINLTTLTKAPWKLDWTERSNGVYIWCLICGITKAFQVGALFLQGSKT